MLNTRNYGKKVRFPRYRLRNCRYEFALKVAHKGTVALICKAGLEEANTYFAQGGIASVTNLAVDNFDKHIEDTMIAGDWISDRAAVEKVVRNAPEQISELINGE